MPGMDKTAGNTSRTAIQIFVAAPHGKVRAPIMKLQKQIASCVGQIETHHAASGVTPARDAFHIKGLTGRVIYSSEHDQCDVIPRALDQ